MNHQHTDHPHPFRRRFGTLAAAGAALAAVGLVATLGVAGAAHADDDDDDDPPTPWTPDGLGDLGDFTVTTLGPLQGGPSIPLPVDDGPPIYVGPSIAIPNLPNLPDDTAAPDDTTAPDDTVAPETTAAPDDTAAPGTTVAAAPTPAPTTDGPADGPASAPTGDVPPFLQIASATVDCAGFVHVTFETGASPELAPDAEHIVTFSPASDPASAIAQRLLQRPQNGMFTLDIQVPAAESYRVTVTADFEPANLDGVLLVDEADAVAPVDCPVPAGS